MEHSFSPSSLSSAPASQFAVVVVKDIDPGITITDLQRAIDFTGSSGWDLRFDKQSVKTTLEIRFPSKEFAEFYIARYNSSRVRIKVSFQDMSLECTEILSFDPTNIVNHWNFQTGSDGQWSPTLTSSTTGYAMPTLSSIAADEVSDVDDGVSETVSTVGTHSLPDTIPWPGKTYRIQHYTSGHLLTLVEGRPKIEITTSSGGWHWACVERDGWLGFRNAVSGTYMGIDKRGGVWSKYQHHENDEYFCVRRHPEGGYIILAKHNRGRELWPMAVDREHGTLVEKENGDDRWLFRVV